ncbi:MAG: ATP-binding protein [Gaiellaceae bacterium]
MAATERQSALIRPSRWPLRAYFAALVGVFALVAAALVVYVDRQTTHDAVAAAERNTGFAADNAAISVGQTVTALRQTALGLAATANIGAALSNPPGCSLTFGNSIFGSGHIDTVSNDGRPGCSSFASKRRASYAGASWLAAARKGTVVRAPIVDAATGHDAVLVATRMAGGAGVVAVFGDLKDVGRNLVTTYGGGYKIELVVADRAGHIVARSIHAGSSIGKQLPFGFGAGTHSDRDGTSRIYAESAVPGVGWRVLAGEDKTAALAAGMHLRNREIELFLVGLAIALAAAFFVYRRVARPIALLGREVRAEAGTGVLAPVSVKGPAEVSGLAQDINELIASVEMSERNYRVLFEGSPLPMFLQDADNRTMLDVNDAALERYGYTRVEFLKLALEDIVAADDWPLVSEEVQQHGTSERIGPLRHIAADGSEIQVRTSSYEIAFDGRRARFTLVEDVGDAERLERQLRQSQRLESLGRLAGGIAHDFNNLLSVILSYAALVKDRVQPAAERDADAWQQAHDDLNEIEDAALRAGRLTRQLLAFARKEIVQPTVVDINAVVRDVETLLQRTLGDHIELSLQLDEDVWPMEIDPTQLEQVLVNLAVNARDAMPDGGQLAIDTDNVDVDVVYAASQPGVGVGPYVQLQVSDTGIGMGEETVQRAFEPFFTTKPEGEGTGLGLATVYGIVTQAGGRVQVYSEPGHGTTVRVLFPRSAAARLTPSPTVERRDPRGGDETILVVEDEQALRAAAVRMLEGHGYRVLAAADGLEALELAGSPNEAIDLVITDVVMPKMLGREVSSRVGELQPGVRSLFVSGYAQSSLGLRGTLEPGVALLTKPFSEAALVTKVRQVLDAV